MTNVYQAGPRVDLLAKIDPERDSVTGQFRRQGQSLMIPAVRAAQLNLDVDLPEQYELLLNVARTRGNESLNLGITVGVHQTMIVIEGWGKKISGLNLVDGRLGEDNATSTTFPVFTDDSIKSIRVIVRRESVLVDVEGNVFIDYRGAPSRLAFDGRFYRRPNLNQLMLGGWESEFRVTKWTLTPLSDQPVDFSKTPESVIAKNDNPTTPPGAVPRVSSPGPEDFPSNDAPIDRTSTTAENQAGPDSPGNDSKRPVAEASRRNEAVVWQVQPDSYPGWDGRAAADISLPMAKGWVVVPDGPSPFFMAGTPSGEGETVRWSVYDVRTGNSVGTTCELPAGGIRKLCPSGRYLMSYVGVAGERRVAVHSFVSGEQVYEADSPNLQANEAQQDVLALNHALLQVRRDRDDVEFLRVDLRTGAAELTWKAGRSPSALTAMAVSPGGRYLLAHWRNELRAYDSLTGQLVGQVDLSENLSFDQTMAFSIDGSELAMLGHASDRSTSTLWCLDWTSGETKLLDVGAKLESLQNTYVLGPALQWFPNKELLLYYGRDVLDRQTGKYCYQIPNNLYWQNPRRTLGSRSILGMMPADDPDQVKYRAISLDRSQLDAALDVVRRGGIAEDIGLPPLTIPDSSSAKVVSSFENTGRVAVNGTPRPELPAVKLPMRFAQFQELKTELRRIEFCDPPATTAVIHFTLNGDDEEARRDVVVRYDLQRQEWAGSIPIRADFRLAAVSPDGTRALVGLSNSVDGYSRFDVVELANRKHIAGWRPFRDERYAEDVAATGQPAARNPRTAIWVRFVDNDRVVAVNPAGKLICWQLPDCRVLYMCDDFGLPLALSADRRFVAGSQSTRLNLLNVREGVWVGKLEPEETPQTILRAGFSPDTGELAAVLGFQGRRSLAIWDLSGETPVEQFDIPYSSVSPGWSEQQHPAHRQLGLDFRRQGYLTLDDLYLVDRAGRSIPWQYNLQRGKHVVNSPDEREWFTEFRIANHGQGQVLEFWMTAAELPSEEVQRLIRTTPATGTDRPIGRSTLSVDGEDAQLVSPSR